MSFIWYSFKILRSFQFILLALCIFSYFFIFILWNWWSNWTLRNRLFLRIINMIEIRKSENINRIKLRSLIDQMLLIKFDFFIINAINFNIQIHWQFIRLFQTSVKFVFLIFTFERKWLQRVCKWWWWSILFFIYCWS